MAEKVDLERPKCPSRYTPRGEAAKACILALGHLSAESPLHKSSLENTWDAYHWPDEHADNPEEGTDDRVKYRLPR